MAVAIRGRALLQRYVPLAYQPIYDSLQDYRYDFNGIYRIDAGTQLIAGVVSLLTGRAMASADASAAWLIVPFSSDDLFDTTMPVTAMATVIYQLTPHPASRSATDLWHDLLIWSANLPVAEPPTMSRWSIIVSSDTPQYSIATPTVALSRRPTSQVLLACRAGTVIPRLRHPLRRLRHYNVRWPIGPLLDTTDACTVRKRLCLRRCTADAADPGVDPDLAELTLDGAKWTAARPAAASFDHLRLAVRKCGIVHRR